MTIERLKASGYKLYAASKADADGLELALVQKSEGKRLFVSSRVRGFAGDTLSEGGLLCPLTYQNARKLMSVLPWLAPQRLPEGRPSFGFGDRIGLATPGHVRAVESYVVFPVLAQQSVREITRTGRSFEEVLSQAVFGAFQQGFNAGFGADADHLKAVDDALHAADLGYTLFTCDPSEYVVEVDELNAQAVAERFRSLPEAERLLEEYAGRETTLPGIGTMRLAEEELARAAVKYCGAVRFAADMYRALEARCPGGFDFELSVDETNSPTRPAEHWFVVSELGKLGVGLASLAPRFPGAMEKAVDWRGDLATFRDEFHAHMAIARALGSYRLSLHSGSDKFSLYPLIAEEANGLWHVKTAGTSYLVALGVTAEVAPQLFREIAAHSIRRFAEERHTYHLTTDTASIPDVRFLGESELPTLLVQDASRQVLHVAFGSVLQSPLGASLFRVLEANEERYSAALREHLGRHLALLGVSGGG